MAQTKSYRGTANGSIIDIPYIQDYPLLQPMRELISTADTSGKPTPEEIAAENEKLSAEGESTLNKYGRSKVRTAEYDSGAARRQQEDQLLNLIRQKPEEMARVAGLRDAGMRSYSDNQILNALLEQQANQNQNGE